MRINHVKHAKKPQQCGKCGDKIRPSRDEKQTVVNKRTGKKTKKTVRVLGDGYRWFKFNRGAKYVRCMKSSCAFRPSDYTKGKMSGVYSAQETADDAITEWDGENVEDLKQILADAAEAIREVAQEYSDSADNMEAVFTGGSPTIDDCRDKQEQLESWADELDNVDFDDFDGKDETDTCRHCDVEIVEEDGKFKHDPESDVKIFDKDPDEDHDAEPHDEPKNSDGQTREEWAEDQRNTAEEALGNCPV